MTTLTSRCIHFAHLVRLNKPIGIFLVLWPTLWGLWLASDGAPSTEILITFMLGTVLMRSAGCAMNDFADRNFDGYVQRTQYRPIPQGKVTATQALLLAGCLSLIAFLLVIIFCNALTIKLAVIGALIAIVYPFLKRITHLPQLGLGVAFSWGVPMAFAAVTDAVTAPAWFLFATCMLWPIIYDTMYAMVDREDDKKIGIKSTAIWFAQNDVKIIAIMQAMFMLQLIFVGNMFDLHAIYYLSLLVVAALFSYQQHLIKDRLPERCMQAFMNNNWVGLVIFLGVYLSVSV